MKAVRYHPKIQEEVLEVIEYYESQGGKKLGDAFFDEFLSFVHLVSVRPMRYPPGAHDLRRVNLKKFPYNFLYRIEAGVVKITVLRHNRRRPKFGLRRK